MPKFSETVNIQPVATGTGGASALMSVADRLESFNTLGQQAVSLAGQMKQKEIAIDAAHLKAQRDAYFASFNTDARATIGEFKNLYSDDLVKYNEAVNGYVKGLSSATSTVPEAYRTEALQTVEDYAVTGRLAVQSNQIARQKTEANATMQTELDAANMAAIQAASQGDIAMAGLEQLNVRKTAARMVESGAMSEDDAAKYVRESERESTEQIRRSQLDAMPIEEATGQINKWEKEVPKGWEPDEWDTFIGSARQDVKYRQTIEDGEKTRLAEADKDLIFGQIANGEDPTVTINTSDYLDADEKMKMTSYAQSQSDRAKTAKQSEINQNRADIRWEQEQYTKAATIAENTQNELLMGFYNDGLLTTDLVNASDAPETLKADLNAMLKKQEETALKIAEEDRLKLAGTHIQSKMGEWEYQELLDYGISQDMDPQTIEYWWDQNKSVADDPDDYQNQFVYKLGVTQLAKDKTNGLFIGKRPANQVQINRNNQLYMKVAEEYQKQSSVEGADPTEILNNLKQPFVEESAKGWIRKLFTKDLVEEAYPTGEVQTIDYSDLSDKELEAMRP